MMTDKNKALLGIFIWSILGGGVSTATKFGLGSVPPFTFSFWRFLLASVFLLPLFLGQRVKFDRSFLKLVLLSFLPVLNVFFFVLGVKTTTASIGQMLYAGVPLFVGIFSYTFFKEKLSRQKWFYILVGLLGVALVIFLPIVESGKPFSGDLRGNLLILIGVFTWSIYMTLSKPFHKKYSSLTINSLFMFVALIVFFFLSLFEAPLSKTFSLNLTLPAIYAIIYTGLLGTAIAYTVNQWAIKKGGSVIASLAFYLLPVFAYFSAFLILGEQPTFGLIMGTAIVFVSIGLISYSK